jgi:hypothetical protein
MIEKYITNINNFDINMIDHERFNLNKDIYNLYNNTIEDPLHKFWFIIDSAKYINNYYDYNILKFVINDKNDKIKKTLDFIKTLSENIKNKYIKFLEKNNIIIDDSNINFTIELPFKQYDNYPCILNLYNKELSYYTNNNDKDDIKNIKQNINYLILFEINYFKIIKTNNNSIFNLKFNFNIIKIQIHQTFDINNLSLNTLINNNIDKIPIPPPPPILLFKDKIQSIDLMNEIKNAKLNNNNDNNKQIRFLTISEEEIQKKKYALKPITINDKEKDINEFNINQALKDQKILLKKVDLNTKIKKKKPKKDKNINKKELDLELEKELESCFL